MNPSHASYHNNICHIRLSDFRPQLNQTFVRRQLTILALFLVAFGTGGIKPCVSAFGGDQFKLPEQEKYLGYFFSMFYFAINAGSLISTFMTPILRADVHCFGSHDCYSLAFGVPGILMISSIGELHLIFI